MKHFAVFAAVLCVAVRADETQELRTKVMGCIKESGISHEKLLQRCTAEDLPTEETEVNSYKNLLACAYEAFGVIKENGSGVDIAPEKAVVFVPPEKRDKILEIVKGCSERAKAFSTVHDAGFELFTCFRENHKEDYAIDCQSLLKRLL